MMPAVTDPDKRQGTSPLLEAALLLVVTFALAVGLGLPTLWFVIPFTFIALSTRRYATYGLSLRRPGSLILHVAVVAAVFVPYVLGYYALVHWRGETFQARLPPGLLRQIVEQIFIVGLPEEFFFRGYLQTELDRAWGRPYRLFGARWGLGLPVAAALFALCHIVYGGPGRLIVFFPGVLYGWLRARTGTIAIPALYHAGSNVLMHTLAASTGA